MKITINEFEEYNFRLPETISKKEFMGLLSRLNFIGKIISRDESDVLADSVGNSSNKPIFNAARASRNATQAERTLLYENRHIAVELFRAFYTFRDNAFWEVVKKYNLSKLIKNKSFMSATTARKIRDNIHKISPVEVGLTHYLGKGETNKLMWKIKKQEKMEKLAGIQNGKI